METEKSLVLKIARHIKQEIRKNKGIGITRIKITIGKHKEGVSFTFGDSTCLTRLTYYDVREKVYDALTAAGVEFALPILAGNDIGIAIYGKPCKTFRTLSRALNRLVKFELNTTDVFTADRNESPLETRYLCYNEHLCNDALMFIRERTPRDKVNVQVMTRNEGSREIHFLSIEITTPTGLGKAYKEFCA